MQMVDVGTDSNDRVDYPAYAKKVCETVLSADQGQSMGILLCGSGVGVSIAANRFEKIYAALCWSPEVAALARQHDNANVLVLPADFVSNELAVDIVKSWLDAEFLGGRYQDRLDLID